MGLFDNPSGETEQSSGLFSIPAQAPRNKYKPKGQRRAAITAPGQPAVTAPGIEAPAGPKSLPPIFSVGQSLLKGLLTSGAAGIEVFDEAIKLGDKPISNAARNVNTLWGPDDVFQPGAWGDLKTGEDVLTDTLGVKEETFYFRQGRVVASKDPILGGIPLGTNTFWGGLGLDIATDPLSYTPLTFLSTPIKVGASFARNSVRGANLAAAREISERLASSKVGEKAATFNERNLGVTKNLQKDGLQNVKDNIIARDPKAAKVITKAEEKLANNVYKTVKVEGARPLSETARDIAVSAIDAGVKAAKSSYVSNNAVKFLREYAQRDVKGLFGAKIATNVTRNSESGLFEVLSGNKVKLGEAGTKEEANALAKRIQQGLEPATQLTPAGAIAGARQGTEEAPDAVTMPTAEGGEVTIETLVPHQADNGKVYVYDGDNVAEFDNMVDAGEWVRIITSPTAVDALEPVVSGSKGKYQVRVGESVTRFKTKREADAYAGAVRTGEAPTPTATTGGTPILDSRPPLVPMKEVLKAPSTAETSALKAVLKGVDDVAKKASGWRSLVNKSVANQIRSVLSQGQVQLDQLLLKATDGQLSVIKEFVNQDITATVFLNTIRDSGPTGRALAATIETLPIQTSKGTKEFSELLSTAKGNFLNLSKANEGIEGAGLEAQVLKAVNVRFYQRAQQLKTKAVLPASTPEGKYQAIVGVAGEEIATKIQKTGYLTQPTKENTAKVKNILEEITSGSTEVSYQGYDDLITGLQRGDEVSANVLEEIVNLIDPDGMMKNAVVQAAAEPAASFLTRLLTREGGVNTIYEAERRLAMAKDPAMLAKHSGLAYPAEVESMMKADKKFLVEGLEFASTKQAFAEAFAEYPRAVQADGMDSFGRSIMGDPTKGGTGGRQSYIAGILEESTGGLNTSTLGDLIYNTGEAYADNSRAAFAKQLGTSDEVRIIASVLGKRGSREKSAQAGAAERGVQFEKLSGEGKLDYLIERMGAVRDGAGGLGFRFVRTKNRDDISFEKAYQAEITKAKKTKTTPNFSAFSQKHTAYLPMVDILNILKNNGGTAGLIKGYFPPGKVDVKRDNLDWYGLGDAARRVVEMDAAGEVFDVNEIAMRIMRRNESRATPSGARLQILKEAANEIADALTSPQAIAQLKGVHLDNAGSIVKDFIQKSEDYSKQLFDILDEAWITMHAADNISEASRMNNVRLFFRKFVLASDILRLEGGPIAEAMFRAAAMAFADGGRVLPDGVMAKTLSKTEKEFYNLLRNEELVMFREALTKWYRYADIPTAPVGREGMKPPAKAAQNKAQEALDTAMELYAKHMEELAKVEVTGDLTLIKTWEKEMRKIQSRLDKARENAWEKWVQTFHWSPTEGWVKTEQFDIERATRDARQAHSQYVAGKQGVADRELLMADTAPVIPPHRKLSAAEKAKFLKKYRKDMTEAQVNNAASVVDDVSRNVGDEVDMGALDVEGLGGTDKMLLATQNIMARSQKESTEIKIFNAVASYKDKLPAGKADFNRLYRPLLNEDTPVLPGDRAAVKLKLVAERWAATTRGTSDALTISRTQENMATQRAADFGSAMEDLVRNMSRATRDDVDAVWTAMRDDLVLDAAGPAIRADMQNKLAPFVNSILKDDISSVLVQNGMDGASVGQALERYGLNSDMGFPSIKELEGKTPQELVASLFQELPFGSVPPKLTPGSAEAIKWAKNRDKFRASEVPVPLAFSRMFSAIQQLKAEQGIAHNFTAQFGWKAHYKTAEQAKAAGYVSIEAVGGKQSIARFLPDADGGNLFHPDIAADFGRVLRQWNDVYETPALHPWLRGSMKFLGFLKFLQTTARPGHHRVNIVGDGSTMIISTPTKDWAKLPTLMANGADLSGRFTKLNFAADYAKFGRDFEAKTKRLSNSFDEIPGAESPAIDITKGVRATFYRDGKPSVTNLDREKLARDMGNRGIFVPGFVQADIMGQANEIMLTGTTTGNKKTMQKVWSKVARPGHEYMKGLSTATAAYSNVIRGTTAMRVMQSRAWSSYEEMMNAAVKEVNLLHPTVQSLASREKRTGRLLFTYYTWLRVAHNALWDMAINRTGATLAIPKIQYNYAQMQGFDPQSPAVPFEDQNVLPDYLSYSVYGPTEMGPQGPRTYREPLMLLDVLDFWKIFYDPSKTPGENVIAAGRQLGEDVVGPSLNLLGKPILEGVTGTTGGATTPGEFLEDAASNLGFTNLLTGLGVYTPYRYRREGTTNPLTEEDRKLRLENYLFGGRGQDLYRPINVKLGQSQYGRRVTDYNERIKGQNEQNVQSFVDEKVEEGYSREEILDMLKQMGVNIK